MGITTAVTRVALTIDTPPYTLEITTAKLGGLVPEAFSAVVTEATADGVAADGAVLGIGAASSATQRWALSVGSENGLGTTDCFRRAMTDQACMKVLSTSGSADFTADVDAWIVNGVRISISNAPAAAYLLTVRFWAGSDLSAKADVKAMPVSEDATLDINDIGFEPDVLEVGMYGATFDDSTHSNLILGYGVVVNKSPIFQGCVGISEDDGEATSLLTGYVTGSYGIMQIYSGDITWAGEFSDFDGSGLSVTTRLGDSGGDEFGFLALAFGGAVDFWAGIIESPTSTGDQSQTGPNFEPQGVDCCLSQMPALDTIYEDDKAGSFGISMFDDTDQVCNSIQIQDGVVTSNTRSLSDDVVVNLPDDDGSVSLLATFVEFISTGWTWNFSAVEDPAVKGWALAIEEVAVPGVVPLFVDSYRRRRVA